MKQLASLLVLIFVLSGCTAYKSQYIAFRPPDGYRNHTQISGVSLGCEAYADKHEAKEAFGFDIRGAGLLPVMLVLDNKSGQSLEIVGSQSFLIDAAGNYWPVVPNTIAFERLEQSTQLASFFGKGAGKGALVGAAAGGVLATALGIVTGNSVAGYLGKGAAMGAASGAVIGGVGEGGSSERADRISSDLREKGLEGKAIPDQSLANGFLFFPGEAKSAQELRLQWRERESGQLRQVTLPLL
jgi:hypothetical protein